MRVAVSQQKCIPGNVKANVETYTEIVLRAKSLHSDLVVFPELSDTGYDLTNISSIASPYDQGIPLTALKKTAAQHEVAIVAGITEKTESGIFNAAVVIDKQGNILTNYRKIHLYTPNGEGVFTAGSDPVIFRFMGFTVGVMICYDLRFPEFARHLATQGADVLIIPTAWPFPRVAHWNILTQARAIENQCYLVGANRVGVDGSFTFCGNSRIVDPHGVLIASASEDQEELISADLDRSKIDFIRERQPVFSHRRNDLFPC